MFRKGVIAILIISSLAYGLRADINNDGIVNLLDLMILSEEWLKMKLGPEIATTSTLAVTGEQMVSVPREMPTILPGTVGGDIDTWVFPSTYLEDNRIYRVAFAIKGLIGNEYIRLTKAYPYATEDLSNGTYERYIAVSSGELFSFTQGLSGVNYPTSARTATISGLSVCEYEPDLDLTIENIVSELADDWSLGDYWSVTQDGGGTYLEWTNTDASEHTTYAEQAIAIESGRDYLLSGEFYTENSVASITFNGETRVISGAFSELFESVTDGTLIISVTGDEDAVFAAILVDDDNPETVLSVRLSGWPFDTRRPMAYGTLTSPGKSNRLPVRARGVYMAMRLSNENVDETFGFERININALPAGRARQ